jgi:hypothetical protein
MKEAQRGFLLGLCVVAAVLMLTTEYAHLQDAKDKVKLTGAELEEIADKHAVFAGYNPKNGCAWMNVFFLADAKIRQSWDCLGMAGTTMGKWRLVGDKRCIKWDDPTRPNEECVEIYRIGEEKYEAWVDGQPVSTYYKVK